MIKRRSLFSALMENCVIVPVLLVLIAQVLLAFSVPDALLWVVNRPLEFLLNCALISSFSVLTLAVTKRPAVATFIISFFCVVFSIINVGLIAIREHPMNLTTAITIYDIIIMCAYEWVNAVLLVVGAALITLLMILFEKKLGPRAPAISRGKRAVLAASGVAALVICVVLTAFLPSDFSNIHVKYEQNGYFVSILKDGMSDYIEAQDEPVKPEFETLKGNNKPDIIIVKLESFCDGNDFSEIAQNLTPNIEKLKESSISGRIMVSAYGGNTCSTVFDIISGYCAAFTVPSTSCMGDMLLFKQEQKSYTRTLVEQGYQSCYMSSFPGAFTNERNAAHAMGFEKFIGQDGYPEYKQYVPDSYLSKRMISEYESRDTTKPYLMVAETMENHYSFSVENYDVVDFVPEDCDKLTKDENATLKGYLNGLKHDDAFIGELVEYFSGVENEVNIIFFSDHRPYFGWRWDGYKRLGLLREDAEPDNFTLEDVEFIFGTPYFIWNNKGELNARRTDTPLSPSYLMPILFKERGIKGNDVSDFLNEAMKYVDNYGTSSFKLSETDETQELFTQYYRYLCKRDILD